MQVIFVAHLGTCGSMPAFFEACAAITQENLFFVLKRTAAFAIVRLHTTRIIYIKHHTVSCRGFPPAGNFFCAPSATTVATAIQKAPFRPAKLKSRPGKICTA